MVDVVDENVGDASASTTHRSPTLVVQQRAAHAHHDVEEAAEEQRAVEHGGELLLVVHRALRGGAVEGNGKAQATDAEHLREVFHALRPQERRLEVHFVVDASVHHVDNDRRQQASRPPIDIKDMELHVNPGRECYERSRSRDRGSTHTK